MPATMQEALVEIENQRRRLDKAADIYRRQKELLKLYSRQSELLRELVLQGEPNAVWGQTQQWKDIEKLLAEIGVIEQQS